MVLSWFSCLVTGWTIHKSGFPLQGPWTIHSSINETETLYCVSENRHNYGISKKGNCALPQEENLVFSLFTKTPYLMWNGWSLSSWPFPFMSMFDFDEDPIPMIQSPTLSRRIKQFISPPAPACGQPCFFSISFYDHNVSVKTPDRQRLNGGCTWDIPSKFTNLSACHFCD